MYRKYAPYVKSSSITDVTYVHKPGQNKLLLWIYCTDGYSQYHFL